MITDKLVYPSFGEFYNNPSGKGNTAMGISVIKGEYSKRFDALKKKGLEFSINVYKESETSFYFHIKLPSETKLNNYDTVIHFFDDFSDGKSGNLKNYNVNFFSNCPSFIYTFATVYNETGLLIDFLGDKFNDEVLRKLPEHRNPDMNLSYDKSIFFACHYIMTDSRYLQRFYLNRICEPFDKDKLRSIIRDEDTILDEAKAGKIVKVNEIKVGQSTADKIKSGIDKMKQVVSKKPVKNVESKQNRNTHGKIVSRSKIRSSHTTKKKI